jgi:hypothetical protein
MIGPEKALVWLLRGAALMLLMALIPAVMPFAWMKDIHCYLGMGELPDGPIVGYLTRSLSAMYAFHGAIVMFVSCDVRRYVSLIRFLAVLGFLFGIGMLVLDICVDMPLAWSVSEGPFIMILSSLMFRLAQRVSAA